MASLVDDKKEEKKEELTDQQKIEKYYDVVIGKREIEVMMNPFYELDKEYHRHRELLNEDIKSTYARGFKSRCYFALQNIKDWMSRTNNLAPKEIIKIDLPWLYKFWDKDEALLSFDLYPKKQ